MHERKVVFAVGFRGGTWREITVNVPEQDDYVLDRGEAISRAHDIAVELDVGGEDIIFRHVLRVEDPPEDYEDGLITCM